jgi:hypothetical protein
MLLNWSRLGLCVVVLVGGAVSRCVGQETGGVDSSRFELTELITGLRQPMELAVGPAGEVYFIELEGKLKVFDPRLNEVRLIGELAVTTAQENGLIGLRWTPTSGGTGISTCSTVLPTTRGSTSAGSPCGTGVSILRVSDCC